MPTEPEKQTITLNRSESISDLRIKIDGVTPSWRKAGDDKGSAGVMFQFHLGANWLQLELSEHPPLGSGNTRTTMACLNKAAAHALYEELRLVFDPSAGPIKPSLAFWMRYYPDPGNHSPGVESLNFQAEDYEQAQAHAERLCKERGWKLACVTQRVG